MPYPEYGALLPTEALFTEPGGYSGVLRAEAQKRASYLSSMDQFYEELEEATRRFEKQYTLAERELEFGIEEAEWQREFKEEEAEWEREFKERTLETQTGLAEAELALGRRQLREVTGARREAGRGAMTEREEFREASKFIRELYGADTRTDYSELFGAAPRVTPYEDIPTYAEGGTIFIGAEEPGGEDFIGEYKPTQTEIDLGLY